MFVFLLCTTWIWKHELTPTLGKTITRKRPILGRGQPAAASVKPLGVLFVSSKAPFMSVVNRAIKVLDRGPGGARWSSTKVLPLAERISRVQEEAASGGGSGNYKLARQREVLLLATGHAIDKLVLIAAWFRRQPGAGYVVTVRTRWSATVDDIFSLSTSAAATGGLDDNAAEGETGEAITGEQQDAEGGDSTMIDLDGQRDAGISAPRRSTRLRNVSCLEVAVRLK